MCKCITQQTENFKNYRKILREVFPIVAIKKFSNGIADTCPCYTDYVIGNVATVTIYASDTADIVSRGFNDCDRNFFGCNKSLEDFKICLIGIKYYIKTHKH